MGGSGRTSPTHTTTTPMDPLHGNLNPSTPHPHTPSPHDIPPFPHSDIIYAGFADGHVRIYRTKDNQPEMSIEIAAHVR